jgi:hypothetical protein
MGLLPPSPQGVHLGKVEGTSWSFVGSKGFEELGMSTQLMVHYPIDRFCKLGGKLGAYICYMVSTVNLFNLSLTS